MHAPPPASPPLLLPPLPLLPPPLELLLELPLLELPLLELPPLELLPLELLPLELLPLELLPLELPLLELPLLELPLLELPLLALPLLPLLPVVASPLPASVPVRGTTAAPPHPQNTTATNATERVPREALMKASSSERSTHSVPPGWSVGPKSARSLRDVVQELNSPARRKTLSQTTWRSGPSATTRKRAQGGRARSAGTYTRYAGRNRRM
jgi:hypothetical protein